MRLSTRGSLGVILGLISLVLFAPYFLFVPGVGQRILSPSVFLGRFGAPVMESGDLAKSLAHFSAGFHKHERQFSGLEQVDPPVILPPFDTADPAFVDTFLLDDAAKTRLGFVVFFIWAWELVFVLRVLFVFSATPSQHPIRSNFILSIYINYNIILSSALFPVSAWCRRQCP
jgi:hypothetical protein